MVCLFFQPGERRTTANMATQIKKRVMAGDQEIYQSWQVAIVSKTSYLCCVSGFTLEYECSEIIAVSVFLPGSNCNKRYHWYRYHIPTESSLGPEDHPYGLEDPRALPP